MPNVHVPRLFIAVLYNLIANTHEEVIFPNTYNKQNRRFGKEGYTNIWSIYFQHLPQK